MRSPPTTNSPHPLKLPGTFKDTRKVQNMDDQPSEHHQNQPLPHEKCCLNSQLIDISKVNPEIRQTFPDIFKDTDTDLWKKWIAYPHASETIRTFIEERKRNSMRSISNFKPYTNFIAALNRKIEELQNDPDKKTQLEEFEAYLELCTQVQMQNICEQRITDLLEKHPYEYNIRQIGEHPPNRGTLFCIRYGGGKRPEKHCRGKKT